MINCKEAGIGGPRTVVPRVTPCRLAPWQNVQFALVLLYIAAPEPEVVVGGTVVVGGVVVVGGTVVVVGGIVVVIGGLVVVIG